ncbi:MAG TPA: transcription termination/antitermination NusG family protein [Pyrinomonadaceae bacterium]
MDFRKAFERSCWYAIHTRSKEEDRAEMNLAAWGIPTLAPKIREPRYNQFTGKPTYFTKPLFPRYLFAQFNAETLLHKVCYTRGVQSVVSSNNHPLEVDDEAIAFIRSRMDENNFVSLDNELKRGDEVTIKNGSLKGLNGIFDKGIKGTDRVIILLQAVNYQAHITIDKSLVRQSDRLLCAVA